ncbi:MULTISPECIES: cytochrome c oxidase subunit II [Sulfitobacter]|jgi:cytochrome c oxidase subunit 2|uniref:Cytochrome c oxidase subunit 2 n=1 Tax=Sulfitobacter pontiacus TaxID=60137 RepID=A0A1H2XYK1_9RHOB|nr:MULTISPECIES: cytochrome c oxidase subunit II [Sulfitobacter]HBM41025.1 cytochrome c oxidase subunit II [Sulfitobacter sp.]KAJ30937.1 cytochrome C oxidase subunit II [Sulfitobacter pontiacus 3SOLIMAR09]QPO09492.1 cytochrome c oxidase subunit II [Sulfitobacter sp. B30-2]UWR19714.1 cytochrome c oxidase subunit II [Sulfitobacter pontiacus]SDW98032.1 cytochrome c oxidase subunit 2 [Sulfitobacter pontiacus]|tara:strand:- start:234 stop:1130 length:897 start_codon:yes stop_codon:yes gene_type:complete
MKHLLSFSGLMAAFSAVPAMAQENLRIDGLEIIGEPVDGKMGFQPAVTRVAQDIHDLDHLILIIITLITIFVTGLILWVAIRYNRKRNPVAASFTHHTPVEILWTVAPIVILVLIGAYSLPILFRQQEIPQADLTIKATGNQWYWSYEYVDEGFGFDSYMIGAPAVGGENRKTPEVIAQLEAAGYTEQQFLLATDTAVVIPVGQTIVVQVTGSDVIHSWAMPAFGVKQDAVPGRLAETWFTAEKEGVYFGQCSELCGNAHAYMPITVKVVSEEAYAQWLGNAKEEYAGIPQTLTVASK